MLNSQNLNYHHQSKDTLHNNNNNKNNNCLLNTNDNYHNQNHQQDFVNFLQKDYTIASDLSSVSSSSLSLPLPLPTQSSSAIIAQKSSSNFSLSPFTSSTISKPSAITTSAANIFFQSNDNDENFQYCKVTSDHTNNFITTTNTTTSSLSSASKIIGKCGSGISENNNNNNNSGGAFFSFNDLTTALQQDHLNTSNLNSNNNNNNSTLIETTNSSSPTSSTLFGISNSSSCNNINSSSVASIITNNSNNNINNIHNNTNNSNSNNNNINCNSPSSSSVISLISSTHSSNGTLNLMGSNSINGSPSRLNKHYKNHHNQQQQQQQSPQQYHNRHQSNNYHLNNNNQQQQHNFHQHNNNSTILNYHTMNQQQLQQQQQQQQQLHHQQQSFNHNSTATTTTYSTLNNNNNNNNNFSKIINGTGSTTTTQSSGGISDASGHSNMHHQQKFQQQQSHTFQRSLSSNSSLTSPISTTSQYQQQQSQQQQQQQQQQQHYHHHHHNHHGHHNHQMQHSPSSPTSNKSCWCNGGDATYHFKTLVPAVAAGAIIGKGGETIAALQKDTGARVKMSKSHDFYPGTQERVCLISGSIEAIMTVVDFIMDKIREKPDLTTKLTDIETKQAQERDKQVKILVPNSTAGMIIGKAGAYIKQIKEESGSYVQISQKPKDITLQERCITVIGEKENNKIACKMIISKIVEDPQSGTCLNVSYADISGPVANFNPTGSPYATNQNAITSSTASLNSTLGTTVTGAGLLLNGTGINLSVNLGAPNPSPNPTIATQVLDHIKVAMRGSGYSETVTTEVCAALGVLAKYGVLGVGVGLPHTNGAHSAPVSYLGVSALDQSAAAASAAATNSVFSALGQVNLEQYINAQSTQTQRQSTIDAATAAAAQFDPFRHTSQAATPISINNNSFGLTAATTGNATAQVLNAQTLGALSKSPTPGDLGAAAAKDSHSKNLEIPEPLIGAVLGPSGRSLVEIQHVSGANIQISKKGIFAPGTRNRIVTISGQPNAITMAHYLIETKINEEETKRARQNTVATAVIQ